MLPGLSSPLRRHLSATAIVRSVHGLCFLDLLDAPQCMVAVLEFLTLADASSLARTRWAMFHYFNAGDDVWKLFWGQPWARGYVVGDGTLDVVSWYGSFRQALEAQTLYERAPSSVVSDPALTRAISRDVPAVDPAAEAEPASIAADDAVCAVLTAPDQLLVLGFSSGQVHVSLPSFEKRFSVGFGSIRHICKRGRRLFIASWNGAVHYICMDYWVLHLLFHGLVSPVYSLCAQGSSLFLCTGDGKVLVYGLTVLTLDGPRAFSTCEGVSGEVTACKMQELLGHAGAVMDIAVSRGFVVSAGMDRTLNVWQRADGMQSASFAFARALHGHTGPVWTVQVRRCLLSPCSIKVVCFLA